MPRQVTAAALQTHHDWQTDAKIDQFFDLAVTAADQGAQIILPSELFATPDFCKTETRRYRDLARPATDHPLISRFASLAQKRSLVIPVSFYERAGDELHNSMVVIDADGSTLATLDLDLAANDRAQWGAFQMRQPQNYRVLVDTLSGLPPS
ncbi:MAG: nitrilase-related carbon-nitrogen hydrolase [Pseudomonadota bacterium]